MPVALQFYSLLKVTQFLCWAFRSELGTAAAAPTLSCCEPFPIRRAITKSLGLKTAGGLRNDGKQRIVRRNGQRRAQTFLSNLPLPPAPPPTPLASTFCLAHPLPPAPLAPTSRPTRPLSPAHSAPTSCPTRPLPPVPLATYLPPHSPPTSHPTHPYLSPHSPLSPTLLIPTSLPTGPQLPWALS